MQAVATILILLCGAFAVACVTIAARLSVETTGLVWLLLMFGALGAVFLAGTIYHRKG